MTSKFTGVFTAIVTPFKTGEVDYKSLGKLLEHQVNGGIDGFVVSGTTGESPNLTDAERKGVFKFLKKELGNSRPIVIGTGTNSTASSVTYTHQAEDWGADGVLVVVPYYNKPPQRGLSAHFRKIAASTNLPTILYNVPSRTITSLSAETVAELSHVKNIVGIKEASGDMDLGKKLIAQCDKKFFVTSGDDGTGLDLTLLGGVGAISVLSHIIPRELSELYKKARGQDKTVTQSFKKFDKLTRLLFSEANPIPVKTALKEMGLIGSAELRLPLVPMDENLRGQLISEMRELEILK